MFDSILVPVDGSEHAKQAVDVACHLLKKEGLSKVYLLHVPEVLGYKTTMVWGLGVVNPESTLAEREQAGETLLEKASVFATQAGAPQVERLLVSGDPARVILDVAKANSVDAIVMGSRGLSDLGSVMIGSVSHKVSHAAKCSVITVRN
ncbi:universal stress protein [Halomonas qinghailakensis]|uniref:Universal stress protein n=2 Tax=Halomonas TaxID=2745 RepID=A0AA46TMS1_9GAMM|nr:MULTISPECIES: universal stress protein [Halomonas]UYO73248.1 universal stress protein [Halomonas sp. ZZQ-149]UYV18648.1 universal stress protein [Halomonas qaidamensis]